jgi:hypothetical protein
LLRTTAVRVTPVLLPAAAIVLALVATACQGPKPVSMEAETSSYHVQLDLDAASLGHRTATIEITDDEHNPVSADQVVLSAAMQHMDMTGPSIVAEEIEAGRFEAEGELFEMLGDWTLTVRIDAPGSKADEQAQFTVDAKP